MDEMREAFEQWFARALNDPKTNAGPWQTWQAAWAAASAPPAAVQDEIDYLRSSLERAEKRLADRTVEKVDLKRENARLRELSQRCSDAAQVLTEEQHRAAVKVLTRANGFDGLPQRMLDAIRSAAPAAAMQEAKPVAYLDIGSGGYTDIGTDLTDKQLSALPMGRHMLGIIGTYGVDGYKPAAAIAPDPLSCERCGESPEVHTGLHWCDNQSFRNEATGAVQLGVSAPLAQEAKPSYQDRASKWFVDTFGPDAAYDKTERSHRFLEEALELAQAAGRTASEARQLVDYVFAQPSGVVYMEVGDVMNTIAAFCTAHGIDMTRAADVTMDRISEPASMARTRQKWLTKPKHSPLPVAAEAKAQRKPLPRVPSDISAAISAYGDARADGANSADRMADVIRALRNWAGSIDAIQPAEGERT